MRLRPTLPQPTVLKKIDRYLLLHYPRLWATKFHYVVYYGLLANIFLNLVVLMFMQPHLLSEFSSLIGMIIFTEIVVFAYWLHQQSLFNIERDYGRTHYSVGIIEMLIYILCALIIFSSSLTMLATSFHKTAYLLGIDEQTTCLDYYSHIAPFFTSKEQDELLNQAEKYYEIDLSPEKLRNLPQLLQEQGIVPRQLTGESHSPYDRRPLERHIDPCLETKAFVTDYFDDSSYYYSTSVQYHNIVDTHTFFAILGILLLVGLKHSDWRTFGFLMLYLLIAIVIFFLLATILDSLNISGLNTSTEQVSALFGAIIFFMLIQSMRLVKAKKYKPFPFLNFIGLPAMFLLMGFFVLAPGTVDWVQNTTLGLLGFFLIYLFFVPWQKKALIYLRSLPRG